MPKFTFVIPCYKSSRKISRCVGSITDQDYKDYEIICVFDGPDEDAEIVLKAFIKAHPDKSIQSVVIPHGGACRARNEGLSRATGEYIIFSDCDMYWQAGILRLFAEKLAEGYDMVYSGYRYNENKGGHVPYDYDPYLFTVFNYIDGANPVRTDLVRAIDGWDEKCERFQDWDLWIRLTKNGLKGAKIEEMGKFTDFPDEDAISGKDSNFQSGFDYVRKKNRLEDRDIILTSIGAGGHAQRIAKMCDWDYWAIPSMLPKDYKAVYLLGMFPESVQDHVSLFFDRRTKEARKCKYLIHWIGTDVLHMRTQLNWVTVKHVREMFEKHHVIHFAQSEENAEEMRELGFKVKLLPLPVENSFKREEMPKDFTISVYDHNGQDQKWHKWLVHEVARAMPDVNFLFYGNRLAVGKEKNTEWLGRCEIKDVIKRSSAHMRLTVHDGFPVAPVEFLLSGRRVLTNVKGMKFTNYVDLGTALPNQVEELRKLVIGEIRKMQKQGEMSHIEHQMVTEHYEKLLNPKDFKKEIERIVYA